LSSSYISEYKTEKNPYKKKKDRTSAKYSATYCCSCNSSPFKPLCFGCF